MSNGIIVLRILLRKRNLIPRYGRARGKGFLYGAPMPGELTQIVKKIPRKPPTHPCRLTLRESSARSWHNLCFTPTTANKTARLDIGRRKSGF